MKMLKPADLSKPMFLTNVVMVWSMVFIGIIIYALVWFVFGVVAMEYITAITDSFDYGSPWSESVELITNVINFHPVIAMFGWILWGFLRSARKDQTSAWRG